MASSPAAVVSPAPASGPHVAGAVRAPGVAVPEPASLAQIIESRNHRPMLRLQALQILEGVCRGLDHVHRNGGIHGDVQPEKIFVTAEGHVRLAGHDEVATAAYASCEVLEGLPPTATDDLFSAACTGYQLLAGKPAFGTGNALQAEAAGRRPARIEHLAPGQWRALDRALAFRRKDRQPDIDTFLNELRSQYTLQSDTDVVASASSLPPAAPAESRRLRVPVIAVGTTCVAAIITLGWWLLRPPAVPATIPVSPSAVGKAEPRPIRRTETAAVTVPLPQPPPAIPQVLPAAPATPSAPAAVSQPGVTEAPGLPPTEAGIRPPTSAEIAPLLSTPPTPSAIVPDLPDLPIPAISLPDAPATDGAIYRVAFSSLKLRQYVEPEYPRDDRGMRTAGWVDVSFGINNVGRTTALQVMGAEPAGIFEEAALAAVKRWRFAPVEIPPGSGGEVRSEIRVRFIPD